QTQQTEQYNCQLASTDGAPISGAHVDWKVIGGVDAKNTSTPDGNNACTTGADGRCTAPITLTMTHKGYDLVCFWAEPPKDMQGSADHDNVYGTSSTTDGKDCTQLKADSALRNDITDVVYMDYNDPRAEGLDVGPETAVVAGATRFSLQAVVYDQFGHPFKGNTTVQAKLFPGSVLVGTGDSDVSKLDPALTCNTGGGDGCSILTAAQNDLGTNLACVWISPAKAPTAMTGGADQESSTCTTHQEVWQETAEQEAHLDPTADDGLPPSPPTDGLDVVRFSVQSRPKIAGTAPKALRQDTGGQVLAVDGAGFLPSARLSLSGTGVTLGPTAVVSDHHLEASLAVAADAPPGARDITVTNVSDGGSYTCTGCFRVIGQGYWMVATDGGIFSFGDAQYAGSAAGQASKPIVAMTPTPTGDGYWMVGSDGGIFAFGDAPFLGSTGGLNLTKPIVSMAATPSGRGYWLVASDGGVFGFGDARFYGALSRLTLAKPIVSIVATPSGRGYWLLASDGGIFAFGDAGFFGSTGDLILNRPIVAMAPTKTGRGYWLVGSDGGIFAYGDATFYGSTGDLRLNKPIVGMTTTPLGKGYWMVATDGGIFSFGDARFFGSTGSITLNKPIVGIARR
ncbi:MAG TPA: hypothetical protein VHL53_13300, partial [Acidimicrobiia bacterium]|nr:hypothetical protein [Acidimicrobiia bacterium]